MAGDRDVGTKLLSEINGPRDNIYDHFFTHLHSFSRYITLATSSGRVKVAKLGGPKFEGRIVPFAVGVSMFDQIQPWLSVFDDDNLTRKIIQMLVHLDTCLLRLLKNEYGQKFDRQVFLCMLREYSKLADKKDMWEDVFGIFCNLFVSFHRNSDNGSDIKKHGVLKAAAATYTLSFTIKNSVEHGLVLARYQKKTNDTVEDDIEVLMREACTVSGWLAEVHEKCGRRKPTSIGDYLATWSIVADLLRNPPPPTCLVKQWVRAKKVRSFWDRWSILLSSSNFTKTDFKTIGQPVALLLPVDSIKVAPVFKQIVNRIHVLVPGEDTREKQELQDREIKKRVGRFVVWSVEMLVFWGMVRQQAPFDAQKDVMKKLKLKYEVDVHEANPYLIL
ncbi:hypothetical protein OROMI_005159 [Orobanche minor]